MWGTDHQGHSKVQQFFIKNAEETFDDFSYTVMQIMTKQTAFLRLQKLSLNDDSIIITVKFNFLRNEGTE